MKLSVVLLASGPPQVLAEARRRVNAFFAAKGCEGEVIAADDLSSALRAAAGDYVLVTEAQLRTPVKEVDKLLAALKDGNCDVAVGSRALSFPSFIRVPCQFKCYSRAAARTLSGSCLRVKKVPVMWKAE